MQCGFASPLATAEMVLLGGVSTPVWERGDGMADNPDTLYYIDLHILYME